MTADKKERADAPGEEPHNFMAISAAWDAATSIVYVVGALIVLFLTRLFGSEGMPIMVKIVMFCLEIGFVVVAIAAVFRALTAMIRDFKELARESNLKVFFKAMRGAISLYDIRSALGRMLGVSLVILVCVLVGLYTTNLVARLVVIGLVLLGAVTAAVLLMRQSDRDHTTFRSDGRSFGRGGDDDGDPDFDEDGEPDCDGSLRHMDGRFTPPSFADQLLYSPWPKALAGAVAVGFVLQWLHVDLVDAVTRVVS